MSFSHIQFFHTHFIFFLIFFIRDERAVPDRSCSLLSPAYPSHGVRQSATVLSQSASLTPSQSVSQSESVSHAVSALFFSPRRRHARRAGPGRSFRGSGRGPSPSLPLRRRLAACACRLPPQPLIRPGFLRLATRWPGRAAAARVRVARRRAPPPLAASLAIPDQRGPTATPLLLQRAASREPSKAERRTSRAGAGTTRASSRASASSF